jgi:NAD(P)-dependent dehydrogenase (short-subunit alcohol dehydrogenase family)
MVVNAGRTHHKAALDFTKKEIENLFNVNLFGAFYTAQAAARAFIKLGIKGSIVFTASMASYRPNKVYIYIPASLSNSSFLLISFFSVSPLHHTVHPKPEFVT